MRIMARGKPFEKGQGGRPKGTKNKLTKTVKEMVKATFDELQGDPKANMLAFAKKYPRDFYNIAAKLIPTEVDSTIKGETIIKVVHDE